MTRKQTTATIAFIFLFISVVMGARIAGIDVPIDPSIAGLLTIMAGSVFISNYRSSKSQPPKPPEVKEKDDA
jgi:hypothetical protein